MSTPILLEAAVRVSGITDFPLYDANSAIGYIPKPNQSGSFLHRNDWAFNELSMGTARPFTPAADKTDILLVGDSIVFGSNRYAQADHLGPQLENASGATVWPISAGSWGLQNELTYLRQHPKVISAVDEVVFVLNSGDFDEPSSWLSELTHPRTTPTSAALYVMRKYGLEFTGPAKAPANIQVQKRDWATDFKSVFGQNQKPITIILFPSKDEASDIAKADMAFNSKRADLLSLDPDIRAVIVVSNDSRWNTGMYRDSVHPSVEGNALLATLIAESLRSHYRSR